jgi:isoquinoline 1-oxidoreductase subunit alpha
VVSLTINGQQHDVDVPAEMPLLWVIRDVIGMTGTKFGCGVAQCGACTVHVDGVATRSCSVPIGTVADKHITTIEGLGTNGGLHPVQQAWLDVQVPQCGYCQSGQIMAVASLLKQNAHPTGDEVAEAITNICRCGTYSSIKKAVAQVASGGKS